MPIVHDAAVLCLSQDEFDKIDHLVMKCAFASQNALGRMCEEAVYENDMAIRLRAEGVSDVSTQVPIEVSFLGFKKVYRLDLVVNGILYELKAVDRISSAHEAQALHYAALTETNRVKLLNFGSPRVEGQLKGCPFGRMNRFDVLVERENWQAVSEACEGLAEIAESSFKALGGFLHNLLFDEILMWYCGGKDRCKQRVPIRRDGIELGQQTLTMHHESVTFSVTSLENLSAYRIHVRSLLKHLPIDAWQWINVRGVKMTLETITI